jgi:hypothetical protein
VPATIQGQFVHASNDAWNGDDFNGAKLNAPAVFMGVSDWERAMASLLGREHIQTFDPQYFDQGVDVQGAGRPDPWQACYNTKLPGHTGWKEWKCDNFGEWNHADDFKLKFVTVGGNGDQGHKWTVPKGCSGAQEQPYFDPKHPENCITASDLGNWSAQILDDYYLKRHSEVDFTVEFKNNGFNAIMFDIEKIDPPFDAAITNFKAVFEKAAKAGILVAVTTSWCGPFHNTFPEKEKLRKAFAADDNVHMWVPQFYERGNETFDHWKCIPTDCPHSELNSCPAASWKEMFSNPKQYIAPAIPTSSQWPQWQGWLKSLDPTLEPRVKGYFQWLQPSYADYKKERVLLA